MLFYGMIQITNAKVGMIQETYNMIDEFSLRAEAKRFTHKTMHKTSCQFLDDAKNNMVSKIPFNSANAIAITEAFSGFDQPDFMANVTATNSSSKRDD